MLTPKTGFRPTPSGNTGSNSQATSDRSSSTVRQPLMFGCDYLVMCGSAPNLEPLEHALYAAFGIVLDWPTSRPGTHGAFYDCNVKIHLGGLYSCAEPGNNGSRRYRISLGGKILSQVPEEKIRDFGRFMFGFGAHCTRFDWAVDDFDKFLDISVIHEHIDKYRCSGFANYTYYKSGKAGKDGCGETLYLGAEASDRRLRIYNKSVESGGEVDSTRVELQARDNWSNVLFLAYCGDSGSVGGGATVNGMAFAHIDFVFGDDKNVTRCARAPWWDEFLSRLGEQNKVREKRIPTSIADKKRWIEKQVTGTLSLLLECLGVDNFCDWLMREVAEKAVEKMRENTNFNDNRKNRNAASAIGFDDGYAEHELIGIFKGYADLFYRIKHSVIASKVGVQLVLSQLINIGGNKKWLVRDGDLTTKQMAEQISLLL